MSSSTDCDVCCAKRCAFSYNKCGMAMVYLLMASSSWIAGHALSPLGYQPDAAQCTRSLKRRLHHVNLPVMSTYKALFENGSCCTPTAGGLRSAYVCARGFTTDLSAFESVSHPRSHPSALKRLHMCQRVATVPDVCP